MFSIKLQSLIVVSILCFVCPLTLITIESTDWRGAHVRTSDRKNAYDDKKEKKKKEKMKKEKMKKQKK